MPSLRARRSVVECTLHQGGFTLGLCIGWCPPTLSPANVGVVAIVADEVESWRRDVHEHPCQELGRVEGLTAALERPLVAIEGKPRLEAEALERQRQALLGKIEYYDDRLVKGWALDPGSPDRSVPIQVLQENRLLFEFEPSLFRWDLMSSGFGAGRQGFVVEVPLRSEAWSGPLRFKFAETGDELENSPVPVPLAEEALWIPLKATDLTGVRVLVLAPHPDDESLACGGALALHRQSGDPIKVVFLTDGSRGDFLGRHDPIDYIELRRKEAGAACEVLGVSDLEFWNFRDRGLAEAPGALNRLSELLTEYAPELFRG